jgi:hypothetical protein
MMPVKARVGLAKYQVVDVAVTRVLLLLLIVLSGQSLLAAVLPEDRADLLYHAYDGGGVEVDGPSVLIRKSVGNSFSGYLNHYVDNVTSASIDVLATASPYTETRTENSVGVDYLHDKVTMNLGFTSSVESDYEADTISFGISQSFFGDLSTVALGYSRGSNIVKKNSDPGFEDTVDLNAYRVSLSQILTKDLLMGIGFETIADEGYLNNPYRSVRYVDPGSPNGFSYQPEVYPRTRTSNALSLSLRYFLPYRASVYGSYRKFDDSWGIEADTYKIGYVQPIFDNWLIDVNYRSYGQTNADFYSDLFPYQDAQNFLARDKELSSFTSGQLGVGVTYEFLKNGWGFIDRGTFNFYYTRMQFDYEDFRNVLESTPATVGQEPLYSMSADVYRIFLSIWY